MEENNPISESQVHFKIFLQTKPHELADFYDRVIDFTENLSSSYIWNNERFALSKPVVCEPSLLSPGYFSCTGVCDYGDNIEDEWFIVYMLNSLTLKFAGKVAAQVYDADGEFLLIHSAHFLPTWAQSAGDNCMKNRVFLYNGELHMIPPASKPSEITYLPAAGPIESDVSAAKCVFDFPKQTVALPKVQECIMKKLNSYVADMNKACFHRTTCIIPAKLAWLLNHNQSLISAAINRFCEKDPNDLKLCRFLNHFKPTDLVSYRIQFTKHLYGKLKYADYKPEKRHEWPTTDSLMAQNLGTTIKFESYSDSAPAKCDSKNLSALVRERSLLGFKLTCAFEILINNILNNQNSKSFEDYLERLKKLGYFKNYLEHSQKYNELLESAKESFLLHEKITDSSKTTNDTSKAKAEAESKSTGDNSYVHLLESIYLGNQPSRDNFSQLKTELSQKQSIGTDDSDDWLCVDAPNLDDYLEMYSRGEASSTYDFSMISNAFKRFLEIPKAKKDLLAGADYNEISSSGELIDFNVDEIEKNLKDLLKKPAAKATADDEADESDSFYEVDDDLLEQKREQNMHSESKLTGYMSTMDAELKDNKNLSRLDAKEQHGDLDLDLNLVSNALESYSSQLGCTGPVSNILKSLGL